MTAFMRRANRPLWVSLTAILLTSAACAEPRYPIHPGEAAGPGVAMARPEYPTRVARSAPEAAPTSPPAPAPASLDADTPRAAPSGAVESSDLPPPPPPPPGSPGGFLSRVSYDDGYRPRSSGAFALDDGVYRGGGLDFVSIALRHRHNWHAEREPSHKAKRSHAKAAAGHASHERHSSRSARAESRKHHHAAKTAHETHSRHALRVAKADEAGEGAATAGAQLKVRRGEDLSDVAKRAGVSERELRKLNGLKRNARLKAGEVLKTPGEAPAKARQASYTVTKGDTLYGLARRFGLKPAELAAANGLKLSKGVHRGQRLKLPEASGETAEPSKPVQVAEPTPPTTRDRRRGWPQTTPGREPAMAAAVSAPSPAVVLPIPVQQAQAAPVPPARPSSNPVQSTQMTSTWAARAYTAPATVQAGRAVQLPRPPQQPPSRPAYAAGSYAVANAAPPRFNPPAAAPAQPLSADALESGRGRFVWPLKGQVIAGFGGAGEGQRGDGVDIAVQPGDSVHAAAAGEVVYAGSSIPGFGNLVLVKHPGGWTTAYAHLQRLGVRMRDTVSQGQEIGLAGDTAAGRPILHFEIRYASNPAEKARPIDPMSVLPAG